MTKRSVQPNLSTVFAALNPERVFILVNPSDEWMEPCYDGVNLRVPPSDVFVPGNIGFYSYTDPAGKQVPGTLRVHDHFLKTNAGDKISWDVVNALKFFLGIKKEKGNYIYDGTYGMAGLQVVADGSTAEEIEEVRKQGFERWKEHTAGVKQAMLYTWEEQQARRAKHGLPALPETDEIMEAREIVNALSQVRRKVLLKRFGLDKSPSQVDVPA